MEEILDLYQRPLDPNRPLVCMDEQPVQLVKEIRQPLPMKPGKALLYDYEYERAGMTNNFLFIAPLLGWRKVNVRQRKTRQDWALEIKQLLEVDFGHWCWIGEKASYKEVMNVSVIGWK